MFNVKSKSKFFFQEERDFVFYQTECESNSNSLNLLKNRLKHKLTEIKELIIDAFEDCIISVEEQSAKYSFNKFSCETKKNIEDGLEMSLESGNEYLANLKEKVKIQFCENKEIVIDEFEELVERIKEMSHFTDDSFQTMHLWKEKTVDSFENLLEHINDKIVCLEKNVYFHIKDKKNYVIDEFDNIFCQLKDNFSHVQWNLHSRKNLMVDEFEDLFENAKWTLGDKKLKLTKGAANAFDDILELADEAIEEGKEEIKAQVDSTNYVIRLCEKLLSDFLQYCEQFTTEFVRSSEKQTICLLHEGKKKAKVFYNEVVDSLVRGYDDKLLCANLMLEINSSRYAYNVTMNELNFHMVRAILMLPQPERPDDSSWSQLEPRLVYFLPMFQHYIRSTTAQRDCLLAIEDVATNNPDTFVCLVRTIHWLYKNDILTEDAILKWYNNPSSETDLSSAKVVRKQAAQFINWLKEAEEQSSDDDDD